MIRSGNAIASTTINFIFFAVASRGFTIFAGVADRTMAGQFGVKLTISVKTRVGVDVVTGNVDQTEIASASVVARFGGAKDIEIAELIAPFAGPTENAQAFVRLVMEKSCLILNMHATLHSAQKWHCGRVKKYF